MIVTQNMVRIIEFSCHKIKCNIMSLATLIIMSMIFFKPFMGLKLVFACVHVRNIMDDNDHIYIVTKFQGAIVIDY